MESTDINVKPSTIIIRGNTTKKQVAFTYDTGEHDSETEAILNILEKQNVKCTFFTTGVWAKKFEKLINRAVEQGHEVGNHSFDHPDLRNLSYEEIINNISEGEKAIKEVTGIKTKLFRLPYGHYDDKVLKAVNAAGYEENIFWSIDTLDWTSPPVQSIVNKIIVNPKNGDIILMHVGAKNTAASTYKAILNLKARGFEFVTVSEILN